MEKIEDDYLRRLDKAERLSQTDMNALSIDERIDMIYELSLANRKVGLRDGKEAEFQATNIQIKRLLQNLPEEAFHSPELDYAAREVSRTIRSILESKHEDLANWASVPAETRISILTEIHQAQAAALGLPPSRVGYFEKDESPLGSPSINYHFIDGNYVNDTIGVNARRNSQPLHSMREDIETTLLLGVTKFAYKSVEENHDRKINSNLSPEHINLSKLCRANFVWRGYPTKFVDDYQTALRTPWAMISKAFINECFGGSASSLFPALNKLTIFSADDKPTYCSIDGVSGYINYSKALGQTFSQEKFINGGAEAIAKLDPSIRRQVMWQFYHAARDEITSGEARTDRGTAATLALIFGAIPFQPEYAEYYRASTERFIHKLKKDVPTQIAKQIWGLLPRILRHQFLQHIGKLQDQAFSTNDYRYSSPQQPKFGELDSDTGGEHDYYSRQITLNTRILGRIKEKTEVDIRKKPIFTKNRFADTLNFLSHEKTHDYQLQIVRSLQQGILDESSPFYRQAQDFEDFYIPKEKGGRIYIHPSQHLSAYRNHPIERQAREIGEAVKDYIGTGYLERLHNKLLVIGHTVVRTATSHKATLTSFLQSRLSRRDPGMADIVDAEFEIVDAEFKYPDVMPSSNEPPLLPRTKNSPTSNNSARFKL